MPVYNPNIELFNTVYVNSIDDLPPAISDVITLKDQTLYEFAPGFFDLGVNRLVIPQFSKIRGQGTFTTTIQSSINDGSTFITATTASGVLQIEDAQFQFTNPNYVLFDIDGLEQLLVTSSFFIGEGNLGRIANTNTIRFGALCSLVGASVGLELDGNLGSTFFDRVGFINIGSAPATNYVYTTPTTVVGTWFSVAGCRVIAPSGTVAFYIDPATTVTLGAHKIEFLGNSFDLGVTAIDGFTPDNSNMFARANFGLRDSRAYASFYVDVPTYTNFDTVNVPVKMNGETAGRGERGFTQQDNQLTYDVPTPIQVHVTASAYLIPASVSPTYASLYIAKNGTVLIDTKATVYLNPEGSFVTTDAIVDAVATDYFEIWLANETDTDKIWAEINTTKLSIIAL